MKRLLSIVLLFALAVTTLAALPVQAAEAPITSTEEDSIVPSPWDNAELDNSAQFLPSDSGDADAADTYHAEDASQEAPLASLPFQDVQPGSWYYDDVVAAYEAGLMEGVSSTKFAPYSTLTRAQVVTVLYRMEGSPSVSGSSGFSDVPTGVFYTEAVTWAAKNGIVKGVTATEFHPQSSVTREQIATIFYRYGDFKGNDVSTTVTLSGYADYQSVSNFAKKPMAWAVSCGLIRGANASNEAPRLAPKSASNRAQVATLLNRMSKLLEDGAIFRSSQKIVDFIKEHEGFSAKPYWDHSQYTIGYGTFCGKTKEEVPASYWNGISKEEAEVLLREAIASNYEQSVIQYEKKLGRALPQGQFDALVSFTFNLGAGWMQGNNRLTTWMKNPTTELQLVWAMGVWCRAGGAVTTGLSTRRIREAQVFLYNDYVGGGDHPNYCYVKYTGNGSLLTSQYTDDVGYYIQGASYGTLPSPTWTSPYSSSSVETAAVPTFLGWFTKDGVQVTSSSIVKTDQVLEARWSK